jgi:hypothetical protein
MGGTTNDQYYKVGKNVAFKDRFIAEELMVAMTSPLKIPLNNRLTFPLAVWYQMGVPLSHFNILAVTGLER